MSANDALATPTRILLRIMPPPMFWLKTAR